MQGFCEFPSRSGPKRNKKRWFLLTWIGFDCGPCFSTVPHVLILLSGIVNDLSAFQLLHAFQLLFNIIQEFVMLVHCFE